MRVESELKTEMFFLFWFVSSFLFITEVFAVEKNRLGEVGLHICCSELPVLLSLGCWPLAPEQSRRLRCNRLVIWCCRSVGMKIPRSLLFWSNPACIRVSASFLTPPFGFRVFCPQSFLTWKIINWFSRILPKSIPNLCQTQQTLEKRTRCYDLNSESLTICFCLH